MVRDQTTVVRTADEDAISDAVVFAVAAAREVCPIDLETPLYTAINPDALDRVFSSAKHPSSIRIEFSWAGCDVVVQGTGRIIVTTSPSSEPELLAE